MENRLIIPHPILNAIRRMRYTNKELIDFFLAKQVVDSEYTATLPLVRIPMGVSDGMTVKQDYEFTRGLERYLDIDNSNSAVLLHFHPINGPSRQDAELMRDYFNANNKLARYGIFVGSDGPLFYETDGRKVFPICSRVSEIPFSDSINTLQNQVLQNFGRAFRSR